MPQLGRQNNLVVSEISSAGVYLDAGRLGRALLPAAQQPVSAPAIGDRLDVFLFLDGDDSLAATSLRPTVQVGEVALLPVKTISPTGAFLDWGLKKDLLLPYGEQIGTLQPEQSVLVVAYLDQRGRAVASMKLDRHLSDKVEKDQFKPGQPVDIVVIGHTELGLKCAVNGSVIGLVYQSDIDPAHAGLRRGDLRTAYVRRRRPDGRLDISLKPLSRDQASALAEVIVEKLKDNDGFLALNDKTTPAVIQRLFGVSKAVFKRAIGQLYRERRIALTDRGMQLLPDDKR